MSLSDDVSTAVASAFRQSIQPTAEALQAQAEAYGKLFALLLKHKEKIERVTFWGYTDARTFRTGQSPLIFDAQLKRKPAYQAIVEAAR